MQRRGEKVREGEVDDEEARRESGDHAGDDDDESARAHLPIASSSGS